MKDTPLDRWPALRLLGVGKPREVIHLVARCIVI